jgi:hypothetical protein
MKPIKVIRLPEFERDFKRLNKRFPTLEEDLETFINTGMRLFHELGVDNNGFFLIAGLGFEQPKVYKVKKFACRSLKGKGAISGIRVIYVYFEAENRGELIEIYFKGDKENEDRERLERYR